MIDWGFIFAFVAAFASVFSIVLTLYFRYTDKKEKRQELQDKLDSYNGICRLPIPEEERKRQQEIKYIKNRLKH